MNQDSETGLTCKHSCSSALKIVFSALGVSLLLYLLLCLLYCCTSGPRRSRSTPTIRRAPVTTPAATVTSASLSDTRISPRVLESLPTFVHSSTDGKSKVECPLCLTDFEDGDKCRFLPGCLHRFHAECIDMWFLSHSACPLCRAVVPVHASAVSIE